MGVFWACWRNVAGAGEKSMGIVVVVVTVLKVVCIGVEGAEAVRCVFSPSTSSSSSSILSSLRAVGESSIEESARWEWPATVSRAAASCDPPA